MKACMELVYDAGQDSGNKTGFEGQPPGLKTLCCNMATV